MSRRFNNGKSGVKIVFVRFNYIYFLLKLSKSDRKSNKYVSQYFQKRSSNSMTILQMLPVFSCLILYYNYLVIFRNVRKRPTINFHRFLTLFRSKLKLV